MSYVVHTMNWPPTKQYACIHPHTCIWVMGLGTNKGLLT